MLKTRTFFTRGQDMNTIVASSAESDSIRNFYTQFRCFFPRFYVVYDCLVLLRYIFPTVLTDFIITSKTFITPFNILPVIKLSFWIKLRVRSFCLTLLYAIRFICTASRAKIPSVFLVGINPKGLGAFYTVSKEPLLFHYSRSILGYE